MLNAIQERAALLLSGLTKHVRKQNTVTLQRFIEEFYAPWVQVHRRSGKATLRMLISYFADFLEKDISRITVKDIDAWQIYERGRGLKAASINRPLTALKSALNWAYKRGIINTYPLKNVEMLYDCSSYRVRYLSEDERRQLFFALDQREARIKKKRNLPPEAFADYLKPMVLIALNTGIRRGSLFALRWDDVNFSEKTISIRAETSKSGRSIHIPLNNTALKTLIKWQRQTGKTGEALIFASPHGKQLSSVHYLWKNLINAAGISDFRWHDMRHDFASRLVIAGADLNTVRELLGHASMKMTLRYAHLSPQVTRKAVEMLDYDTAI